MSIATKTNILQCKNDLKHQHDQRRRKQFESGGARALFRAGKIFEGAPSLLAGAPFDRGHQTKVWGTQRFDRYSSDCE